MNEDFKFSNIKQREHNVVFRKDHFKYKMFIVHVLTTNLYLVSEALKSTTAGAASKKPNEIHLKLDNYQLNRLFLIPLVSLRLGQSFGLSG